MFDFDDADITHGHVYARKLFDLTKNFHEALSKTDLSEIEQAYALAKHELANPSVYRTFKTLKDCTIDRFKHMNYPLWFGSIAAGFILSGGSIHAAGLAAFVLPGIGALNDVRKIRLLRGGLQEYTSYIEAKHPEIANKYEGKKWGPSTLNGPA